MLLLLLLMVGLGKQLSSGADHHVPPTIHAGNWVTASGHLVTVMVGAGVLSLPSAMSWLGWVGGMLSLVLFYAISLWCSLMLTAVYKVNGVRHTTYSQAVLGILGRRDSTVLVVVQRVMLCLAAVGYEIAAADSMTFIAGRACAAGQQQGCMQKHWQMTLVFGGVRGGERRAASKQKQWGLLEMRDRCLVHKCVRHYSK